MPPPARPARRNPANWPTLLRPSVSATVRAQVLPTQRLLLPKGAFIDCTLETAIDSTLPGMTTCVMATDTFGVDGQVVLLERGTKLVGETRGQVQQGSARVFVLWTEARTPTGVIVPLASPGADELGRSGLPGRSTIIFGSDSARPCWSLSSTAPCRARCNRPAAATARSSSIHRRRKAS